MSKRDEIRDRVGATGKPVVLVEGPDDEAAFTTLLGRFLPGWDQGWAMASAGKKSEVIELLRLEPTWLGIVDRDEWDSATITRQQAALPNLLVLPRFSLESYLVVPSELWRALPTLQQDRIPGEQAALEAAIVAVLPPYLRHGALWKVVTPLWTGLRALGFKEALASEQSVGVAQDNTEIQRVLGEWDALLDPQRIFTDFQAELQAAQQASLHDQLTLWVHGKVFWNQGVHPVLNGFLGQASASDRRTRLLKGIPQPSDLQSLLARI